MQNSLLRCEHISHTSRVPFSGTSFTVATAHINCRHVWTQHAVPHTTIGLLTGLRHRSSARMFRGRDGEVLLHSSRGTIKGVPPHLMPARRPEYDITREMRQRALYNSAGGPIGHTVWSWTPEEPKLTICEKSRTLVLTYFSCLVSVSSARRKSRCRTEWRYRTRLRVEGKEQEGLHISG